ncbi:MAG: hypothetical protein IH598_00270, partial [Bacteroidales bacterium]|nr:hypothetical protein [Bacteroidales bacterium]
MKKLIFTLALALITSATIFAADYYWVGGTGNWNDFAAHWATTSGGATFHTQAPTELDHVYFDANSFTASGQIVTINVDAYCADMVWTGALNNPELAGATTRKLYIYGSLTFINAMNFSYLGEVYFQSLNTGRTLTSAGQSFKRHVYFQGLGGYVLQDNFVQTGNYTVYLNQGTLDLNDQQCTVNIFSTNNTNVRSLQLRSSELVITSTSGSAFVFRGENLTLNAGTSLVRFTGVGGSMNHSGNYGPGQVFNDVIYEALTGTSAANNSGGSFNNLTFNSNGNLSGGMTVAMLNIAGNSTISSNGNNITTAVINGNATINNNGTYGDLTVGGNATINGNNIIGNLTLSPGKYLTLNDGTTQNFTGDLSANGTCSAPITIQADAYGSQATISKSSGFLSVNYCLLRDISGSGGASFTAANSIDLGNNSGWLIIPPTAQNYYWVGGSGSWNEPAHWSATSGGPGGTCIPTAIDNVFFDASSFSSPGQTVTIVGNDNGIAYCKSMNWSGVTNNPVLVGTGNDLYIYGSLILSANMTFNYEGRVYLKSTAAGNNIFTAGVPLDNNDIYFYGSGGGWTLIDDLNLGSETLYLVEGALNTNNQNVVAGIFNSNYSGITRALNLGSSEITLSSTSDQALRFHPTGMTFDAGTSLIRFTGAGSGMYNVSGSGLAFHDVVFEALTGTVNVYNNGSFNDIVFNSAGTSTLRYGNTVNSVIFSGTGGIYDNNNNVGQMTFLGTATISGNGTYGHVTMNANGAITGNNTIGTLVFTAGNQYTLTASRTQTILNDLIAEGTETEVINIISSSSGNVSTFYKDGDPVVVNYVSLKDNAAAGSATFTANNSIDLGNNPNWIINAPGGKDFYWIGGTGNWDNPANWSLSSGGPAGTGIPTVLDNVFFDGNSFSAPGQVVTLIGDASSNVRFINMDWTGATNNPTLAGAAGVNLRIHGSLTLIPDMIYNALGPVYFHATEPGQTITTAGVVLDKNNMYFSGDGGVWTLQDELNIGIRTLFLEFGTLNPNNQDIVAGIFNSNYSGNTRALILGSSEITLSSTSDQALRFHPTGMTFDAGTSLIRFTGAGSGMYNVSGSGLAFHDVVFEALTGTVNVYNNGSFNDIVFNSAGTSTLRYGNTVNSVIFSGTGGIYDNNNNVGQMTFLGTATISGNGTYGHVTMNANGAITGNNTIGTLVFTAGNQYTLTASRTQTILNDLIAEGTETELIVIKSSTLNSATTFYKEFGAVEVNYVSLQDNSATGGATFTAYNSVDIGGNSGWTILSPGSKDYYWVGGTGNWNDASKWSLTSGGPVGTGLPTANDNVFFDANSFTAPGQVVTIIGDVSNNARVVNMDWTGAAFNPTLAGASNQNLRISGSMILSPGMTVTFVGAVYFEATETGKTITMAGTSLGTINNLYFQGEGGGWTMMDGLNIGGKFLYLVRGSLNTNNQPVTAGIFISDYSGNVRSLTLGSSEITLSSTSDQALRFHATGMTFDAGTSLIRFTGVGSGIYNVSGSGLAFHDVVFEALTGTVNVYNNGSFNDIVFNSAGTSTLRYGNTVNSVIFSGTGGIYDNNTISYVQFKGNGTINGNNTFGILEFAPGNTYTITGGRTQTINDAFLANGTCAEPIIIESSSATATTIEKTAGTVTVTHCYLEGITASGGADFIAENSVDGGNNTGWIFIESVQNLYWVGGTGNWNDIAHWASESGGVGGYCLPTQLDNVIFDGNSFTQTGQAVYVDIADAMCHNMDWSAAAFEPTFTSLSNTYHLTIFGSLSLSPDMNFAFSGPVYFQGEAPEKSSYEIAMAGNSFNNAVYFTGEGGIWTLMDNFTIPSNDLYLNKGTLNTNGRTLSVRRFYSDNNNIRALNLGASVLNIGSNHSLAWFATGSNFTINPGTSEIRFTTANGSFYSLGESVLTYHNVVFQNPGGTSNLQSDDQFNNVTFQPAGKVLGNGTFNNVLFIGNGEINQNNTFGDVTFMNNATIKGSNTFNNLNLTPGKLCQMEAGQTQTILNDLTFWGNADNPITLQSFTIGSQATISKADGIVSGNYIVLKDMLATGGATFNVYNSTDNGNNTGWNFLEPPFATCPEDFDVCENVNPFVLDMADPSGWDYSGEGVYYDPIGEVYMFDPSLVPVGPVTITYTIGGLFPGSCDFIITILPLPVAECIPDIEVCEDTDYIFLYEGIGQYYYDGDPISGFNPVDPGVFPIIFEVTNSCGAATCTFDIIVYAKPEAAISGDLEICQGETTTLTASAGTEYLWSTGETTQSIMVSVAGDYSVEVTGENGCENSAEVTVIVHPLPVVTISGDLEICQSESTTLTASSGSSYLWSTSETTQSIEVSTGGLYSVEVTDANGCKNTAQVTVIVHPLPVVTISGDLEICQGESTTLTASSGSSYLWSTDETIQSIEVSTGGLYSVEVTDANGCKNTEQVTVIVHPLPEVSITGELTFCEGQSTVLTASAGASYLWSTEETTQSITVTMAGLYSVVVTDENGCDGSAQVTTTYLPITIPTCPATMNVIVTEPPFELTGGLPAGGTYSGVGVTNNIFNPAVAGIGNFPITYLIQDVCGPQSCEFMIIVSEEPITCLDATISNFPADVDDVCYDESYSVDFSGVVIENAIEVIWTVIPAEAGFVENNIFVLNPGILGDVTIQLLAVAEDPCQDAQASVGFTVKPLPGYFCEFSNTEICSGEEVTFTHNFEGVAPWTLEYYLGGVLMSFTTSENPYIVTQAFTETTYYEPVHIYSGNGCDEGVSQFTTIEVHPLPTFTYELSAIEICSGDEVTFTNYFTGTAPWTVEFMYNGISNSFTTSDNPQIYVGTFTETTTYEPISVTDGNGCISSLNQVNTITVNPLPTITTEYSATEVCYGETVDFTNYFTGTAPWTVEYEYNGMSGSFTTSDNPDYYSEIFYETTVNEIISVTDGNGCTTYYDSNITTITVYPLPVVGITGELAFCEGQSTVLTATEGASYDWSTGETTQSITVMMAGLYSVVVTDGNGCEGYAEVTTSYLVVTIPACPASMNVLITDP